MTLRQIINIFTEVGKQQPNVRLAKEGDVYAILNDPKSEEYCAFVITQGQHTWKDGWNYFTLHLFYVDRLLSDLDANRLEIQSTAINVLKNIILSVFDIIDNEVPRVQFNCFTEKFNSLTAGAYCTLQVPVNDEWLCPEEYDIENQ